jgi:hypothetical protein
MNKKNDYPNTTRRYLSPRERMVDISGFPIKFGVSIRHRLASITSYLLTRTGLGWNNAFQT